MNRVPIVLVAALLFAGGLAAQPGTAPAAWSAEDLTSPEILVKLLTAKAVPSIFYVGFPVLYRAAHVPGAILAGPGSKPEGLDTLRAALAKVPKDAPVVLYCGCCPWDVCPNVRPALKLIKELGYKNAKVVIIPTNLHTDWTSKGYPVERAAGQAATP